MSLPDEHIPEDPEAMRAIGVSMAEGMPDIHREIGYTALAAVAHVRAVESLNPSMAASFQATFEIEGEFFTMLIVRERDAPDR